MFMDLILAFPSLWSQTPYRNEIAHLTPEKLAHLIKICGFLMQTKIYLFWEKQ